MSRLRRRLQRSHSALAGTIFLTLLTAACAGLPGAPGQNGAVPPCTEHGTGQDAQLMSNWTHKQGRFFNYFVPNDNWRGVESNAGIDISSATGDAEASFAFAQGPGLGFPTNLQAAESYIFQAGDLSNIRILQQSPVTRGTFGNSQTMEFTGYWATTGSDVHGCLEVTYGNQMMSGYLRRAALPVWNKDALTLRLIRDHISYLPANG